MEQLTGNAASMVTVVADKMKDTAIEDESSEEEEDPRVSKLRAYSAKNDAAKTAEYLDSDGLGIESLELARVFLLEAIFDEDEPIPPQIKEKKDYIAAACSDAKSQRALLCGLERYVTETGTSGFKAFSLILNQLYEFDLVEEDVIKAWNEDVSAASGIEVEPKVAQAVRKQAKKFIDWLDESEDEDSD
jgi:translation initiation factor 5